MNDLTYIDIYLIEDKSNLLAVSKEGLNTGAITGVPCRIVSSYNELNIIVQISPKQAELSFLKQSALDFNNTAVYCKTYGKRYGTERGVRHWYIQDITVNDDLAFTLTLYRDTLLDYWDNVLDSPLGLPETPVEVVSETIPSADTKYTGQRKLFKFDDASDFVRAIFPYAYAGAFTDTMYLNPCVLIDVVSDRAGDDYASAKIIGGVVGVDTYLLNWVDLYKLINIMQSKDVLDALYNNLYQGDAFKSIYRVAMIPYATPTSSEFIQYLNVGNNGYQVLVNGQIQGASTELRELKLYPVRRRLLATPTDTSNPQIHTQYMGQAYTFTYDVSKVEQMEVNLPYVGKIDLTSYIEYFEGAFTCVYLLDSLTGEGVFGVVKGTAFNATDGYVGALPDIPLELTVPVSTATEVSWVAIQGNQLDKFVKGFSMVTSVLNGKVEGAVGSFVEATKDNANIVPQRNSQTASALQLMLSGRWQKWGVSYIEREVGAVNTGFRHSTIKLKELPKQTTSYAPDNPYNVQVLKCQPVSWTGNREVDDDIYNVLTQRGLVFNL